MSATKRIRKPRDASGDGQRVVAPLWNYAEQTQEAVAAPEGEQDELALQLIDYDNQHQLAKYWEERRKLVQRELLEPMRDGQEVKADTERERLTGKYIKQERTSIAEERLKKALGAKLWRQVTTPKLDEDKLEAAIQLGLVDPNIVASCSQTNEVEFIKVTRRRKK